MDTENVYDSVQPAGPLRAQLLDPASDHGMPALGSAGGKASGRDAGGAPGSRASPSPDKLQRIQSAATQPRWTDVAWSIVFVIHLMVDLGLMVAAVAINPSFFSTAAGTASNGTSYIAAFSAVLVRGIGVTIVGALVAGMMAAMWLLLFKHYPKPVIVGSGLLNAGLLAVLALVFLVLLPGLAGIITGSILLGCAGVSLLLLACCRRRIPFAAVMLSNASAVVQRFKGLWIVALTFLVATVLWCCIFIAALSISSAGFGAIAPALGTVVSVYLLFSFFWVAQVFSYMVFTIVAGLIGTWFFAGDDSMPSSPTLQSFRRACTYSLGSICLAAFIVAVIRTLQVLASIASNNSRSPDGAGELVLLVLALTARLILYCIQSIVEYLNSYALVYVAVFNLSFMESARSTFDLLTRSGFIAVINDDLVSAPLNVASLTCGLVSAIISAMGALLVFLSADLSPTNRIIAVVALAVIGGIVGLVVASTLLGLVYAAIHTLFVCAAEEPETLRTAHPEIYAALVKSYGDKLTFTDADLVV